MRTRRRFGQGLVSGGGARAAGRLRRLVSFAGDYFRFKRLSARADSRFGVSWKDRYPCLEDNTGVTAFDPHYVYHPAWAARVLQATRPEVHVDIGSSLHFCAIVSAYVPVRFYDYRPAMLKLPGLTTAFADLQALPFGDRSVASLSCMHVVEHVGLGRYGDALDPQGDRKAMAELARVLAVGGSLLLVVPVGRPRVRFNAHRIYSCAQIADACRDLELVEFSLIPDDAASVGMMPGASHELADRQEYGCGCFWFRRAGK